MTNELEALQGHARLTIRQIEGRFKNRGWTTGLKKWEQELLYSAYVALNVPNEERKFGLDKINNTKDITKRYRA